VVGGFFICAIRYTVVSLKEHIRTIKELIKRAADA
jgi:hypothetical protein